MDKFHRNYVLSVQDQLSNNFFEIEPPFTIEFNIERAILSSANTANIRIYNLSPITRNRIYMDIFDFGNPKNVILRAGYDKNMPVIFNGNYRSAWSVREGNNFITQLDCFSDAFGFVNGKTNRTFPTGTLLKTIIESVIGDIPGAALGFVGDFPGVTTRASSYSGNACDIVRELSGNALFFDLGNANALKDNECFEGSIAVLDSDTGLLNTPRREQQLIYLDILFEPRIQIGQRIRLDSQSEPIFNGDYKVISVKHQGMISDAVCGNLITTVGLFLGEQSLRTVSRV